MAITAGIDAATDVTGYGLVGHLRNMLVASRCSATIDLAKVPLLNGARTLLSSHALVPASAERNYFSLESDVIWDTSPFDMRMLLCDPQTSGGLLLSANPAETTAFLNSCNAAQQTAAVIGHVTEGPPTKIAVEWGEPTGE